MHTKKRENKKVIDIYAIALMVCYILIQFSQQLLLLSVKKEENAVTINFNCYYWQLYRLAL